MTPPPIPPMHRLLFAAAAAMVFALVCSGVVVCITDASQGCPDWPTCHDRLIPPMQLDSILEWTHRVATPLTLPFIIAAAVVAWRRYRPLPWIFRATMGSIVSILIVVVFGAIAVLWHLPRGWAAADLGTALLALALMVTAATVVSARGDEPSAGATLSWRDPLAKLSLISAAAVYAVLVSGVLVARPGSVVRCLGWPSLAALGGDGAPADLFTTLQLARLALAAVATVLVVLTAVKARRADPVVRRNAWITAALLGVAIVAAALVPSPDAGVFVPLANMLATEGLWAFCVAVTVRSAALAPPR